MEIITGWADGGLQKFELKNYLQISSKPESKMDCKEIFESDLNKDQIEWNLKSENEKDFIRTLLLLGKRIICCTNLGSLYLINIDSKQQGNDQKLLFKSILFSNFNVMTKVKLSEDNQTWLVAIGTLKGFIYLLRIKPNDDFNKDLITIDCLNCLSIEEELENPDSNRTVLTPGSTKIFNLIWFEYKTQNTKPRYFLIACYSFLNGLMHLYELDAGNQINLAARLYLPQCKHRWLTSYSIAAIKPIFNESTLTGEENLETKKEMIYLTVGDKCGNLHLFEIERGESLAKEGELESFEEMNKRLGLVKPRQTIKNFTKENDAISAIYSKKLNENLENYLIICCCKDGYYRVLELNIEHKEDENDDHDVDESEDVCAQDKKDSSTAKPVKEALKLINKYQINSYIDIIESFIFEDYFQFNKKNGQNFELEKDVRLALCFYGDKFLLWNFQLNRALFEFKCGGANRSWDFEFYDQDEENLIFRFVYIKNKAIGEISKVISRGEIRTNLDQGKNHFCQIFHGNMITVCKYLKSSNYLLTGGEDTQLIVSKIIDDKLNLHHQYHLHGHDSVVKCLASCELNSNETLIVSGGGKANIKIWKAIFAFEGEPTNNDLNIEKIIRLYEFKRFRPKKNDSGKKEKPWLYIDLKSNPDIRFMDVDLEQINQNLFKVYFACSDGFIRLKYLISITIAANSHNLWQLSSI